MAGYSYSTTGKNIAQIHKEMKRMPDALLDEISRQDDAYSSLALTELKDRNTQKAMQQAMQPPAPTVADNVRNESANRGVESLALAEQNFREGGIIGYANEGLVLGEDDYRDLLMAGFNPNTFMQDELPRDFMSTGLASDSTTSEFDRDRLLAAGPAAGPVTKDGFSVIPVDEFESQESIKNLEKFATLPEKRKVDPQGIKKEVSGILNLGPMKATGEGGELAAMEAARKAAGYDPNLYKKGLESLQAEKEGYTGAKKRAKSQVFFNLADAVLDKDLTQQGYSTGARFLKGMSPAFKGYSQELDKIDEAERLIDRDIDKIKQAQNQLKRGDADAAQKTVNERREKFNENLLNAYEKAKDRIANERNTDRNSAVTAASALASVKTSIYTAEIGRSTDLAKIHASGIADILTKNQGSITDKDIYGYIEELQGMAGTHKELYVEPFLMEASPEKLKSLKDQFVKIDSGAASLFEQAISGDKEKSTKARQKLYERLQSNVSMQNLALSYSAKRMADALGSMNVGNYDAKVKAFEEQTGLYGGSYKKGGLVGLASY